MQPVTIGGVVLGDGSILSQYGPGDPPYFTVAHPIVGQYEIAFIRPFSAPPATVVGHAWNVNLAEEFGGTALDNANIATLGVGGFVVETADNTGAPTNRHFTFIAFGNLQQ
jgi:hypothetical protein